MLQALPAPRATRALFVLALAKACLGVIALVPGALVWSGARVSALADAYLAVLLVLFTAVGAFLALGGRRDRRSLYWGGALLVLADPLASTPLGRLGEALHPGMLATGAQVLASLPLEVFLPALLWRLSLLFTRLPDPPEIRRPLEAAGRACWWGGGILLLAQAWALIALQGSLPLDRVAAQVSRMEPGSLYPPILAAAVLPPLVLLARRLWVERGQERLFISGVLLGLLPVTAAALLGPLLSAGTLQDPRVLVALGGPLILVPLSTAWAVAARRPFELHPMALRELQYASLRGCLGAGLALPVLILGLFVFHERHRTLAELFSSGTFFSLMVAAGLAIVAFSRRRWLLDAVERRLFPEHDSRLHQFQRLLDRLQGCTTVRELGHAFEEDLQRQLPLEGTALLVRTDGVLAHSEGLVRPLEAASSLASLLAQGEALTVDLEDPRSVLRDLPLEERYWLVDSGAHVLLPLRGRGAELIAFLLLRGRPEELPFLPREREALALLAGGAALTLELVAARQDIGSRRAPEPSTATAEYRAARECPECGRIEPPPEESCPHCQRALEQISLPHVLPGRLRLERRIGTGRMGVIYRARDLALGRALAVKTLPRLSPEDALRLRREARAAAAVSHPHLEIIYGVETWRGTPMIFIELLAGGSLRKRLEERGAMTAVEVLELGAGLAAALAQLHRRGILHRDIKPGTILYSPTGVPKLADFDLARLTHDSRSDSWEVLPRGEGPPGGESSSSSSFPSIHRADWLESLFYRSPETVGGRVPDEAADLWSLHAVLFECLAGRRLFVAQRLPELLAEIQNAPIPTLDQLLTGAPGELSAYLGAALHRDPTRRPASAREAQQVLERMRRELRRESGR